MEDLNIILDKHLYQANFRHMVKASSAIVLRWMSLDLTDDKAILAQVMTWCHQELGAAQRHQPKKIRIVYTPHSQTFPGFLYIETVVSYFYYVSIHLHIQMIWWISVYMFPWRLGDK